MLKKLTLLSGIVITNSLYSFYPVYSASNAATEMDKGLQFFAKKDYKNALPHFVKAANKNAKDSSALYYEAVTYHQLNDINLAKSAYYQVLHNFPGTPAASNAHLALLYLDPVYAKRFRQQTGGRAQPQTFTPSAPQEPRSITDVDSDMNSLPDQARVPYQKEGADIIVIAYINNRPIDVIFDSGAEAVVLRKSVMDSLGSGLHLSKHFGYSYGVGDGGAQKTFYARGTVKVGQIERKNFPISIQDDSASGGTGIAHPLLGQSFFRDFTYTLEPSPDGSRGTILFQKKTPNRSLSAKDSSVIPFTNVGREVIVNVEINGRKTPMIFDTGASLVCFTRQQFAALGLTIPDDAVQGLNQGIAGTTTALTFTLPSIRLGSVLKTDVPVSVVNGGAMPLPLLGQSFFHDLRIDIDNDSHLMRVRR